MLYVKYPVWLANNWPMYTNRKPFKVDLGEPHFKFLNCLRCLEVDVLGKWLPFCLGVADLYS